MHRIGFCAWTQWQNRTELVPHSFSSRILLATIRSYGVVLWIESPSHYSVGFDPRSAISLTSKSSSDRSPDGKGVMSINRLGRLARNGTGALLVLLLSCVYGPTQAEAGCSHLVTAHSDRGVDVHGLDALITGGAASLPGDSPVHGGPRPGSSCSGPLCSSRDSLPLPASALPDRDRSDQWGSLTQVVPTPIAATRTHITAEPTLDPRIAAAAIFHPPRV
jgi:hypothetical protein